VTGRRVDKLVRAGLELFLLIVYTKYVCVCTHLCMRVCMCVRVYACVCMRVNVRVCVCVSACALLPHVHPQTESLHAALALCVCVCVCM